MPALFASTIQIFVALVFLISAVAKLRDVSEFRELLGDYRLVPAPLLPIVARAVPILEILVAGGLLFRIELVGSTLLGTLLFLAFAAAIAINLARGRTEIDCGCNWGQGGIGISRWMVVRNIVLAAALGLSAAGFAATRLMASDWLAVACASGTFLMLYHALPVLLGQGREAGWTR